MCGYMYVRVHVHDSEQAKGQAAPAKLLASIGWCAGDASPTLKGGAKACAVRPVVHSKLPACRVRPQLALGSCCDQTRRWRSKLHSPEPRSTLLHTRLVILDSYWPQHKHTNVVETNMTSRSRVQFLCSCCRQLHSSTSTSQGSEVHLLVQLAACVGTAAACSRADWPAAAGDAAPCHSHHEGSGAAGAGQARVPSTTAS